MSSLPNNNQRQVTNKYKSTDPMEKHNYSDWKAFMQELRESKQKTQQLSKLYIIIHEKVRRTLQQCTTNPKYDATDDVNKHLDFIKDILIRLANKSEDSYLRGIKKTLLQNYERHLYDLVDFLRATAVVQGSKELIDVKQLVASQTSNRQHQFDLKDQLKRSNQRRIRSKSGQWMNKDSSVRPTPSLSGRLSPGTQDQLIRNLDAEEENTFLTRKEFADKFHKGKSSLEKKINENIEFQGTGVSFKRKYNSIEKYLDERREFENLYFCQDFYNKILKPDNAIEQYHTEKPEARVPGQSKIFPEFNIKTKFMKAAVKKNILSTVLNAKMELLDEFHRDNVAKMKEINEVENVQLKPSKSSRKSLSSYQRTAVGSNLYSPEKRNNLKITIGAVGRRASLSNINSARETRRGRKCIVNTASRQTFRTTWYTEEVEHAHSQKLFRTMETSKFGQYWPQKS